MIRTQVAAIVSAAVASLQAEGALPASGLPVVDIAEPRDPSHGDFACNFALVASKAAGKNPREIAEKLVGAMDFSGLVTSAEVAGPGFLNLRLKPELAAGFVGQVLALGEEGLASGGASGTGTPPEARKHLNIEFVSVNPNGPITVGSGRGAAFGSTLANVLQAAGHGVHREYYINDGVNSEQMRQFAASVQSFVEGLPFPEQGYKGDYVQEVADEVRARYGSSQSMPPKTLDLVREEASSLSPGVLENVIDNAIDAGATSVFVSTPSHASSTGDQECQIDFRVGSQTISSARLPSDIAHGVLNNLVTELETDHRLSLQGTPVRGVVITRKGSHSVEVEHDPWKAKGEFTIHLLNEAPVGGPDVQWYQSVSQALMLARQRTDLAAFGVEFDTWFSEQSLHDRGMVERDIADLEAKGAADARPIRAKLKLGKGGVIEDVELEPQTGDVDEEGGLATTNDERRTTNGADSATSEAIQNPKSKIQNQRTLWLRSTKFGDDMDRVLRRQDGRLTYIASDVSYHKDKFNRGSKPGPDGACEHADKLITVLGPDHHGYIGRLHAVLAALLEESTDKIDGVDLTELEAKLYASPRERAACEAALAEARDKLEVVIFQIVRFVKEGKPAPMRKRDGNIYSLRDLMAEIGKTMAPEAAEEEQMTLGKDVARFFYLMRSHDTHMDFDIDLATKQSDENPVFYCQYAHARICSVLRKAEEAGFGPAAAASEADLMRLTHERELALIKKVCDLPFEVQRCAEDYGVHRLTTYTQDLARTYHYFYDVCRVIQPEDEALTRARLALCRATAVGLRSVFGLLGISAPERMDRAAATA